MSKIQVRISRTGNAQIEVSGVSGPACKTLTEKLEKAIGTTTSSEPTADFYNEQNENQNQ